MDTPPNFELFLEEEFARLRRRVLAEHRRHIPEGVGIGTASSSAGPDEQKPNRSWRRAQTEPDMDPDFAFADPDDDVLNVPLKVPTDEQGLMELEQALMRQEKKLPPRSPSPNPDRVRSKQRYTSAGSDDSDTSDKPTDMLSVIKRTESGKERRPSKMIQELSEAFEKASKNVDRRMSVSRAQRVSVLGMGNQGEWGLPEMSPVISPSSSITPAQSRRMSRAVTWTRMANMCGF